MLARDFSSNAIVKKWATELKRNSIEYNSTSVCPKNPTTEEEVDFITL